MQKQREYLYDNVRVVLIFLVIVGHCMELFGGSVWSGRIYRIIYSFHMPAFIFLTGYFAKFHPRKIVLGQIWPYLIFQTCYLVFQQMYVEGADKVTLQYTTPHWMLWYLFAIIGYELLLPLLETDSRFRQVVEIVAIFVLSLLAGYDQTVDYYMSLSRFFTFWPFFLLGHYARKNKVFFTNLPVIRRRGALIISLVIICFGSYQINAEKLKKVILYGSKCYEVAESTAMIRAGLFVLALAWIIVLFSVISRRRIPGVTGFGQRTFYIYLLHGFVVRILQKIEFFRFGFWVNMGICMLIALALIVLLGNRFTERICSCLFTGKWFEKLWKNEKESIKNHLEIVGYSNQHKRNHIKKA